MSAIFDLLSSFWEARSTRERALLTAVGGLLGGALLYSVLWAPAAAGRARLAAALPVMQSEFAQMMQQAQAAQALRQAASGAVPAGEQLRRALLAALAARGINEAQVSVLSGAVQIRLQHISFGVWIDWLDEMRKQVKIQVVEAHISSFDRQGRVDLNATLQTSASD